MNIAVNISLLTQSLCCRFVRVSQEFYTCLYSDLKDKCNATVSAIYTKYDLIAEWRFLPHCEISEYTGSAFVGTALIVCCRAGVFNLWSAVGTSYNVQN